jgi:quinoprotein glucose dehydrogenase
MFRLMRRILVLILLLAAVILGLLYLSAERWTGELFTPAEPDRSLQDVGWPVWGNNAAGHRYSTAGQVTPANVDRLKPVWTFRTGETGDGYRSQWAHTFQATPILAGETLFFSTAYGRVFALDAESGEQRWKFDAGIDLDEGYSEVSNRGVAFWSDSEARELAECNERVFLGTLDARLIALDAQTGKPCEEFAGTGQANLFEAISEADRGSAYPVTSPPVVIGDTVVLGSGMHDNWAVDLGLGTVWAYDARTGGLRWKWHAIPRDTDAENAAEWIPEQAALTGTANVWAPISADPELGLVYAATGSASPDYYGGERLGSNRHANSLVALDAETGEVAWTYQLIRHDLWDYDIPAQPVLAEIMRDGIEVPVVIQPTKMGMLFTFNRETGEPFYEIEERPVPDSDIEGEETSPTQPFPVAPPTLSPHHAITEEDAWGLTFWDRGACKDLINSLRSEGIYTPPSLQGTIMSPGNGGGVNWGGMAWEPGRQIAVANSLHLPFVVALIPRDDFETVRDSGRYPDTEFSPQHGTPYGMRRKTLLSPLDIPCVKPPWGTLAAVDMVAGEILWKVPFGTTRDMTPFPFGKEYGMPGLGGPMILASGLVFIGAAMDDYLRAFDLASGGQIWRHRLPGGGQATPMTYQLDGRQYIVIAAGGHARLGTTRSDHLVAFALVDD